MHVSESFFKNILAEIDALRQPCFSSPLTTLFKKEVPITENYLCLWTQRVKCGSLEIISANLSTFLVLNPIKNGKRTADSDALSANRSTDNNGPCCAGRVQ
ncbi:hypothetical protein TNCV_2787521 [Trichonephila clavipes]|uniref:Uncharacterized protein n=1 Tax=Trichonephila clavipes TaxID=2585209 RepID=A0A8X6SYE9_TRICX|nr:hypothetical protein TNCV_2787521 [Trichonephila clavipes]